MAFTLFFGICAAAVFGVDRVMISRWGFGIADSVRVFRGIRWVDANRLPAEHSDADEYRFFRALEEGLFLNSNAGLSAERITEYLESEATEHNAGGQFKPATVISPRNVAGNITIEGGDNLFQNIFRRENIDFERLDEFCPYLHDDGKYLMRMAGNEFASFANALLQSLLSSRQMPGIIPNDIDMTIRAIVFGRNTDEIVTADVQFAIDADAMVRSMLNSIGFGWLGDVGSFVLPEEVLLNTTIGISEDIAVVMSAGTMNERQTESFHRVIDGIFIMANEPMTTQSFIDDLSVRFIAPVTALVGNFVEPDSYYDGRIDFDPVEMVLFLSGINEGDEEDVTSRSLLWGLRDYSVVNGDRWTTRRPMERDERDALGQINDKFFRFDTEEARVTSIGDILDGRMKFDYDVVNTFDESRFFADTRSAAELRPFIRDIELSYYIMSKLSLPAYGGGDMGDILDIEIGKVEINGDYFFTISLLIEYMTDSLFAENDFGGSVFIDFADRVILRSTTFIGLRGDDINANDSGYSNGNRHRPHYLTVVTLNEMDVDEDNNIMEIRCERDNFQALMARFGGTFDFEYRAYNTGRMIFDHFSEDSQSSESVRNNVNFEFAIAEGRGGILLEDFISWKNR